MPHFANVPVPVRPLDAYVVPPSLDRAAGHDAVARAVKSGIARPSDIDRVDLEQPSLLFWPFWRVAVSVDGFHLGLATVQSGRSGRSVPIPTGGARHKDGVVMIAARSILPYEAKLPSWLGSIVGTPPLEVGTSELVAADQARELLAAGEVVDADIHQARGEAIASGMLLRAVNPSNAIFARYDASVRASVFCLYPVYYARYRYDGEARRHAGEELFVAVSARTGKTVAARHPSVMRALTSRLRKALSFDSR